MSEGNNLVSKWTVDTKEVKRARDEFGHFVKGVGEGGKEVQRGFLDRFKQFGDISTGLNQALEVVGKFARAIGAVGNRLIGVIETGVEFEDTFAKAMAQLSHEDVDKFSGSLRALALQMGKDTAHSAEAAAQGIEELIKAGLTAEQVMGGGLKTALDLASAGELSVADAAATVAINLKTFKLEAENASQVADLLAGAANVTAADVSDMSQALNQSGVVMSTLKIPMEDGITALSLMAEAGLMGSDAGTSLKTALLRLVPTSKEAAEAYEKLGITVFDTNGQLLPMRDIVGNLETAFKGLTDAEKLEYQTMIFGQDAIRASSILIDGGVEAWDRLKGTISEFSAADVASRKLDSLAGDLTILEGSQETLNIAITQGFVPGLRIATQWITEIVNKVAEWVQANTVWLQVQITGAIESMIGWLQSLWQWLQATVESMGGWGAVTEQAKLILVNAWNTISSAFSLAWQIIEPIIRGLGLFFSGDGEGSWAAMGNAFKAVWDNVLSPVIDLIRTGFEILILAVSSLANGFKAGWQLITGDIEGFKATVTLQWNTILEYFGSLRNKVASIFDAIVHAFRHPLETIHAMFDGMTAKFKALFGFSIWPEWFEKLANNADESFGRFSDVIGSHLDQTAAHLDRFSEKTGSFVVNFEDTLKRWQDGTIKTFERVGNFIVQNWNPFVTEFSESYLNFLKQVEEQFGIDAIPDKIREIRDNPTTLTDTDPPTTVPIPPTTTGSFFTATGGGVLERIRETLENIETLMTGPSTLPAIQALGGSLPLGPVNGLSDLLNSSLLAGAAGGPAVNLTVQTNDNAAAIAAAVRQAMRDISDRRTLEGVRR